MSKTLNHSAELFRSKPNENIKLKLYIFPDPCRRRKTCGTELHKKAQNGKENNLSHFGESEESNTNFKLWSFRKN